MFERALMVVSVWAFPWLALAAMFRGEAKGEFNGTLLVLVQAVVTWGILAL